MANEKCVKMAITRDQWRQIILNDYRFLLQLLSKLVMKRYTNFWYTDQSVWYTDTKLIWSRYHIWNHQYLKKYKLFSCKYRSEIRYRPEIGWYRLHTDYSVIFAGAGQETNCIKFNTDINLIQIPISIPKLIPLYFSQKIPMQISKFYTVSSLV